MLIGNPDTLFSDLTANMIFDLSEFPRDVVVPLYITAAPTTAIMSYHTGCTYNMRITKYAYYVGFAVPHAYITGTVLVRTKLFCPRFSPSSFGPSFQNDPKLFFDKEVQASVFCLYKPVVLVILQLNAPYLVLWNLVCYIV